MILLAFFTFFFVCFRLLLDVKDLKSKYLAVGRSLTVVSLLHLCVLSQLMVISWWSADDQLTRVYKQFEFLCSDGVLFFRVRGMCGCVGWVWVWFFYFSWGVLSLPLFFLCWLWCQARSGSPRLFWLLFWDMTNSLAKVKVAFYTWGSWSWGCLCVTKVLSVTNAQNVSKMNF